MSLLKAIRSCGMVVKRGSVGSGVVLVIRPRLKMTMFVSNSSRVALIAGWKYTRIYNPQRRLRVLVEKCHIDSSQPSSRKSSREWSPSGHDSLLAMPSTMHVKSFEAQCYHIEEMGFKLGRLTVV
ncbi:hypothetical protein TNCV_2281051 [Trichonephila clavipes]|nr:hypothetical protein TNCV_2281051 [Trichonephila clavipes]